MFPGQVNVNLDRGYDSDKTRAALEELGFTGEIATQGRMDERLRQAPPLHREALVRCELLPLPVRRNRHASHAHPPRDLALPLGRTVHHQETRVTPADGRPSASGGQALPHAW